MGAEQLQEDVAKSPGVVDEEVAKSSGFLVVDEQPGEHDLVSSGGHEQEEHKKEGETEKYQKHAVKSSTTASDSTASVAPDALRLNLVISLKDKSVTTA